MNGAQRIALENLWPVRAGNAQALLDIRFGFIERQRLGLRQQRQSLP